MVLLKPRRKTQAKAKTQSMLKLHFSLNRQKKNAYKVTKICAPLSIQIAKKKSWQKYAVARFQDTV